MVQENSVKPKIVIVVGPTASGKTSTGVQLAKTFNGEIISADSMQVYKGMDVGTAKVTESEMQGIPHHLINVALPTESYSVSLWKGAAENAIKDILSRGKTPIIVGGTGLYITSLIKGYTFFEVDEDTAYRKELQNLLEEKGSNYLYNLLCKKNPELAKSVHPNKTKAVIRFLEILKTNPNYTLPLQEENYDYLLIGLDMDRNLLYERINKRVDKMVEDGLVSEVEALLKKGTSRTSLGAIGYKEIIDYLDGKLGYLDAINLIKQHSRNYAKRQITYMKRMDGIVWVPYNNLNKITLLVENFLKVK